MFNALPIITRYWFGATMIVTLSVNFGILSPYQIMWSWTDITSNFEIWRFASPFLFAGKFDFNTLIACMTLVSFSKQYEAGGPFNTGAGGGTADYVFCVLLGALSMMASYPLLLMAGLQLPPLFCKNLIFYVMYVWSKRNPTSQASIWGFPVKAIYLPFAYLAMTVFLGNPYMDMLHGIAMGHLYYFAVDVIPQVYGKDFLHTPNFLIDYFGVGEYQAPPPTPAAGAAQAATNRGVFGGGGSGGIGRDTTGAGTGTAAPPPAPSHSWGSGGNRLGTN